MAKSTAKRKRETKLVKHDPSPGWAVVVGGAHPYVSNGFHSQPYHKAVPAVVLTLADYRRLLKAARSKRP